MSGPVPGRLIRGAAYMTTGARAVSDGSAHTAVLYQGEQEYMEFVGTYIAEGVSSGASAWVAVPTDKLGSLRDAVRAAVGKTVSQVMWADITTLGRNPGRILGMQLAFLDRHRDRPVRMVAEAAWPGRSAVEYVGCMHHEALVNITFAGLDVQGLCPYDASGLEDGVLDDAHLTHPLVEHNGSRRRSAHYSVDDALHRSNEPLITSPAAVTCTVGEPANLSRARQHSSRYGRLLGLSADRLADLQLIVTELATNSLQHGGGSSHLLFWECEGHLVCEARDSGQLADPLVGRRPPARDRPSPSGLFVVNALADLVRTHSGPDGTTIQAFLRLDRLSGENG